MIIHLDMDGVLVDFEKGFKQHTGMSVDSFQSPSEFWKFAQKFDHLYADLPMMPDAHLLIRNVRDVSREYGYHVEILTAVPSLTHMPNVTADKERWIKRHCPYGWKFKTGPHAVDKQLHAKPGDILIDDKIRNIAQWTQAGGVGILHKTADLTTRQLKTHLGK